MADEPKKRGWIVLPHVLLVEADSLFPPSPGVAVAIPECCVYCCAPAHSSRKLQLSAQEFHGRKVTITRNLDLTVQYCETCLKKSKLSGRVATAFVLGYALFGTIMGLAMEKDCRDGFYAAMFFITGAAVGFAMWAIAVKHMLGIFFPAIRHTPILSGDGALGIRAVCTAEALRVRFTNNDFAEKFLALNSTAHYEA